MAEGDLGLSGPVVAAYESYWPAKSQVILGSRCDNAGGNQVSVGVSLPRQEVRLECRNGQVSPSTTRRGWFSLYLFSRQLFAKEEISFVVSLVALCGARFNSPPPPLSPPSSQELNRFIPFRSLFETITVS